MPWSSIYNLMTPGAQYDNVRVQEKLNVELIAKNDTIITVVCRPFLSLPRQLYPVEYNITTSLSLNRGLINISFMFFQCQTNSTKMTPSSLN